LINDHKDNAFLHYILDTLPVGVKHVCPMDKRMIG